MYTIETFQKIYIYIKFVIENNCEVDNIYCFDNFLEINADRFSYKLQNKSGLNLLFGLFG